MKVYIRKKVGDTSLTGWEYLLDENNLLLEFDSVEAAQHYFFEKTRSMLPWEMVEIEDGPCPHPVGARRLIQTEAIINCETTVVVCGLCGKRLTAPVTDCR